MPKSKQRHYCEIESCAIAAYGQAVPVPGNPSHVATLSLNEFSSERRIRTEPFG